MILNKKHMTAAVMLVCFSFSYLPVTGSWYMSMNGRSDLSRLIISAMMVKKQLFQNASNKEISNKETSKKDLDRSMQLVFKELKIATGQVKVGETHKKSAITLTEIVPDFPVPGIRPILNSCQDYFILISYKNIFHKFDQFPPDPPPPEHLFVS